MRIQSVLGAYLLLESGFEGGGPGGRILIVSVVFKTA